MKDTALKIIKAIKAAGKFEALMVGGCVRDILIGKTPKDFDVATDCPMEILEKLFKTHDIGANKTFGIVVVDMDGVSVEVAQFRKDVGSADGRHPDSVQLGCSFKEDSARRDFTINAMGMTEDGTIIDFHGGMQDLQDGTIRCVGEPFERFKEDELRIIRALRFAACLGFDLQWQTLEAIQLAMHHGTLRGKVAPERIKQELFKTAAHGGPAMARFIELARDAEVLEVILPEIAAMIGAEHTVESHPEGVLVERIGG